MNMTMYFVIDNEFRFCGEFSLFNALNYALYDY